MRVRRSLVHGRLSAISVVLIAGGWSANANAQLAVSGGIDGGVSFPDAPIAFVDPAAHKGGPVASVALGIDIAAYYLFEPAVGLGFAITPTLYGAGPEPSSGLNFGLTPRLLLRPEPFHIALDVGFVLSSFEELCSSETLALSCPRTREARGSAPGFGVGLATLTQAYEAEDLELLLGPAVRYQWARYPYEDGPGAFDLQVWQVVFAVRVFMDIGAEVPSL